jgi:hypothetical protein
VEPIIEWWFDLKREPMTDKMTIAKTEITMLQRELISWNSVVLCRGKGRGEIEAGS